MNADIKKNGKFIRLWLLVCLLMIAAMVFVGGYTRLSGSGLSITEWKPIHGIIPPLNESEWSEEFSAYQASPQYEKINMGMNVEEFKIIFWPEYWHRVLGRLIGMVFLFPLLFFAISKSISPRYLIRLTIIFALGGLQGLVGWIMVKSGLVNDPHVSHFKLAMHLSLALLVFCLILWAYLDTNITTNHSAVYSKPTKAYVAWFALLCTQVVLGALVAGLHAGLIYNSWPDMNGRFIPSELWQSETFWHEAGWVQFFHRTLAVVIVLGYIIWWFLHRIHVKKSGLNTISACIAGVLFLQFLLGVATLMTGVKLELALAHQLTALLVLALSVTLLHGLTKKHVH